LQSVHVVSLFPSLLNCQFKNVCGHRETHRAGLARLSFDLPRDALRLCSRILSPKFYFTCHDTYSRNRHSTTQIHTKRNQSNAYGARASDNRKLAPVEGG
jgi:hypothetical protein